jgi:hypothetical protein
VFACFALAPTAQAVVPAPDGGYPNFTTAEGTNALKNLTSGAANTAIGWYSLFSNTDGSFNTAVGAGTLVLNIGNQGMSQGVENTAVGTGALLFNTTGSANTAVGLTALLNNTTAPGNTAVGADALLNNTTGDSNTATGVGALFSNTTGGENTAVGTSALFGNTTGGENAAVGFDALMSNMTGTVNTAVGPGALVNSGGNRNTAVGAGAGSSLANGDSNVYIGSDMSGVAVESEHTYIRNINTTSVSGGGTDTVTVDLTTGLLGHLSSSRRYKEDIQPMNNASETLYRLKPVTYRYKKEIDHTQLPAFGLIAEDVAEVNPALVAHDNKGLPESVHYEMVNAMLLNEFLKEHRTVEEQQKTIAELKSGMTVLAATVKEQAAQIQKVSAQLEASKPAPQVALNKSVKDF